MKSLQRVVNDALLILRTSYGELIEDRQPYRSDIRRLIEAKLGLSFGAYEQFLERYGFLSLDRESGAYTIHQAGREIAEGSLTRREGLEADARHHFANEINQLKSSKSQQSGRRFDLHYLRYDAIGKGSLGSLWKGEHFRTSRPCALKLFDGLRELSLENLGGLLKQLEEILRKSACLDSQFIVSLTDLNLYHSVPYCVMELCEGGSLRQLLKRGTLSPEVALQIFAQLCHGLIEAHEKGVYHLDLKPENILLNAQGNVKIFDFGVGRVVARHIARRGRQAYVSYGSLPYMAPELMRDPYLQEPTIDIYALGMILYEALVGELPGRRSPMPSQVIKGLPEAIDNLFDSMTQDQAEKRPQSIQEVLEALRALPSFDRLAEHALIASFTKSPTKLPGLEIRDDVADPLPEEEERGLSRRSSEDSLLSRRSVGEGAGRSVAEPEAGSPSGASKIWGEGRDRGGRSPELTMSEARVAPTATVARPEDLDAEGELDLSIDMLDIEDLEESRRVAESAVKIQERLAQIQPKDS